MGPNQYPVLMRTFQLDIFSYGEIWSLEKFLWREFDFIYKIWIKGERKLYEGQLNTEYLSYSYLVGGYDVPARLYVILYIH